uniref:rRNA biogenesis protein RRP36 n=1 Tax=Steinernema glaseri TaxID=37863 RepID=A0A1I7ZAJ5_9BILA
MDTEQEEFRKRVAALPLKKVKELQQKLGLKLFQKMMHGDPKAEERERKREEEDEEETPENKFKRENRMRPREVSCKKPVSVYRNVYGENTRVGRKKGFDPRFDARCGEFDAEEHEKDFGFLDGIRKNEKEILKKEYNQVRKEDPEKAARLKKAILAMENREKSRKEVAMKREVIEEIRETNIERMNQGIKPIYVSNGEVKRRQLEKKFQSLKKGGKLKKYMERKAKKVDRKDRRPEV